MNFLERKVFSLESNGVYGKLIVNRAIYHNLSSASFSLLHVVFPFLCLYWDRYFQGLCPEPGQSFVQPDIVVKLYVTMRLRQCCYLLGTSALLQSISDELETLCRKKGSVGSSSLVLFPFRSSCEIELTRLSWSLTSGQLRDSAAGFCKKIGFLVYQVQSGGSVFWLAMHFSICLKFCINTTK